MLGSIRMGFLLVVLPLIQISQKVQPARSGMKCQVFGGIQLKDYPGRWSVNPQLMGVSLGLFMWYNSFKI